MTLNGLNNYAHTYGKPHSSRSKLTRLPNKLGSCNRNPNFRLWLPLHHLKVFGFGSRYNHPKLFGIGLRLHSPSICFIPICHYCVAL